MGFGHPECPARLESIIAAIKQVSWHDEVNWCTPKPISKEDLFRVHDKAYIENLLSVKVSPNQNHFIDPDTAMNEHTLEAAKLASGCLKDAVSLVCENQCKRVACLVRPPGHHAEIDKAMGFCFFNHIAVGAAYALEKYKLERVAILDFDVHHGNGTEKIFSNDNRVFFWSSFQHPFYPGVDLDKQPAHFVFDPLSAGSGSEDFRYCVDKHLFPALRAFSPELIFISAGFDAHQQDPLAEIKLNESDYYYVTDKIVNFAENTCKGRVISTLEGGYHLNALAQSYLKHLEAMREPTP